MLFRLIKSIHWLVLLCAFVSGCVAVNSFPQIARPGDTISVMVGGSEMARKGTVSVTLIDNNNTQWDMKALGLVRSVFQLRPSGLAYGLHYSQFFDKESSWNKSHEPLETVVVLDIPTGTPPGPATLNIDLNTTDESSGISQPFSTQLTIVDIPGQPGSSDNFLRQNFDGNNYAVNFYDLEPAPYAKVSFGEGGLAGFSATPNDVLGAVRLTVDFDETILNGSDLNVYAPESTQRGTAHTTGSFGDNQKMVFWAQDGSRMTIFVVAPRGIEDRYLQVYIVHPRDLPGDPGLSLLSVEAFDVNGTAIYATPRFSYFSQ